MGTPIHRISAGEKRETDPEVRQLTPEERADLDRRLGPVKEPLSWKQKAPSDPRRPEATFKPGATKKKRPQDSPAVDGKKAEIIQDPEANPTKNIPRGDDHDEEITDSIPQNQEQEQRIRSAAAAEEMAVVDRDDAGADRAVEKEVEAPVSDYVKEPAIITQEVREELFGHPESIRKHHFPSVTISKNIETHKNIQIKIPIILGDSIRDYKMSMRNHSYQFGSEAMNKKIDPDKLFQELLELNQAVVSWIVSGALEASGDEHTAISETENFVYEHLQKHRTRMEQMAKRKGWRIV